MPAAMRIEPRHAIQVRSLQNKIQGLETQRRTAERQNRPTDAARIDRDVAVAQRQLANLTTAMLDSSIQQSRRAIPTPAFTRDPATGNAVPINSPLAPNLRVVNSRTPPAQTQAPAMLRFPNLKPSNDNEVLNKRMGEVVDLLKDINKQLKDGGGAGGGRGGNGLLGDLLGPRLGGANRAESLFGGGGRAAGRFARLGRIARIGKFAGRGLGVGGLALGAAELAGVQMPGGLEAAANGAMLGGTVGSIVPGVGTMLGAGVGAGVGLGAHYWDDIKDLLVTQVKQGSLTNKALDEVNKGVDHVEGATIHAGNFLEKLWGWFTGKLSAAGEAIGNALGGAGTDAAATNDVLNRKYGQAGPQSKAMTTKEQNVAIQKAYDNFRKAGLSDHGARAMVANQMAESGMNTGVTGDVGLVPGGSHGKHQWNRERFAALQDFARKQGKDWKDPDVQDAFAVKELQENPKLWKAVTEGKLSSAELTDLINRKYEVSADQRTGARSGSLQAVEAVINKKEAEIAQNKQGGPEQTGMPTAPEGKLTPASTPPVSAAPGSQKPVPEGQLTPASTPPVSAAPGTARQVPQGQLTPASAAPQPAHLGGATAEPAPEATGDRVSLGSGRLPALNLPASPVRATAQPFVAGEPDVINPVATKPTLTSEDASLVGQNETDKQRPISVVKRVPIAPTLADIPLLPMDMSMLGIQLGAL